MKQSLLVGLGLIAGLAHSASSMALSTDRDQPAQIESDDTFIDFKTGVRTLTNNVLVVQGTLRIKADKLVTNYNKQGELVKAVADGSLARFKQRPDNKPDDIEGWAKKISFDYPTNTVTLTGKAALKQGESTATGNKIIYNMATDQLRIVGKSNIGTAGKPGAAKPTRKIEDSFKDDNQGPASATKPAPKSTTPTANNNTQIATQPEQENAPVQTEVAPAKAGRSRLILKPRKKK